MVNLISSLTERGAVSSMEAEDSAFIHRLRLWPSWWWNTGKPSSDKWPVMFSCLCPAYLHC
jgi:hypothetical protein